MTDYNDERLIQIAADRDRARAKFSAQGDDVKVDRKMPDFELTRQRQVVHVAMTGDLRDVEHYMDILRKAAERSGDDTQRMGNQFKIYPRANND